MKDSMCECACVRACDCDCYAYPERIAIPLMPREYPIAPQIDLKASGDRIKVRGRVKMHVNRSAKRITKEVRRLLRWGTVCHLGINVITVGHQKSTYVCHILTNTAATADYSIVTTTITATATATATTATTEES